MRRFKFGIAIVVAAGVWSVAAQAQTPGAPVPQVVTSGVGQAHVTPDRAIVMVGVQTTAPTAAAASTENARRARAVLDTLRSLGLMGDQVSTMNYNVMPQMQWNPAPNTTPKVTGYSVTNTVRADVHRVEDVGRIIDASIAKGANEVSSLSFYSSKADSGRRAALAVAVANARADAEVIAKAAGGSLGQLLEVSTTGSTAPRAPELSVARAMAVQTPIEPGEQTISVSVTARWAFVGGR